MLHIFFGTNTIGVREQAFAHVSEREATGVRVTRIDSDTYMPGMITDALGATSLFGGEELFVIDSPQSVKELATETADNLAAMGESSNQFVIIEGALLAPAKKQYAKWGELTELAAEKTERFNAFGMADALARKDKKSLWILLQEARMAGLSAEEIIGALWWQLKTLRLATRTSSAAEAGLKDYPYKKAKAALSTFKPGEIELLSTALLTVYHDGHAGVRDIDVALERWVLTV